MPLPQRKSNRLPHFNYSQEGAYFVTFCVQGREHLLCRIVGGGAHDAPSVELTRIGKAVEARILSSRQIPGIRVDKFVIMPNHVHLILMVDGNSPTCEASPANAKVPHFVSTLKRLCHKSVGFPFFQRSYHDHVIRDEKDYLRIWNYMDTNPMRWTEDCFYLPDL